MPIIPEVFHLLFFKKETFAFYGLQTCRKTYTAFQKFLAYPYKDSSGGLCLSFRFLSIRRAAFVDKDQQSVQLQVVSILVLARDGAHVNALHECRKFLSGDLITKVIYFSGGQVTLFYYHSTKAFYLMRREKQKLLGLLRTSRSAGSRLLNKAMFFS